jgi:hypothetical protein
MKTMNALTVALTGAALIAASSVLAAPAGKILTEKPGLAVASDDDGGRVELYHRSHAARDLEFHGGPIVREPLVEVVFVGDSWSTPKLQSRAAALRAAVDHVSATDSFAGTRDCGMKATALPITTRHLAGTAKMNDLHMQGMIDKAMRAGSLPSRDENTIYLIFLAPDIDSTLGDRHPVTDYASYHSHFHTQDVNVRYVVVPFDTDAKLMSDAAAASLIRAIVNPDGDGWY